MIIRCRYCFILLTTIAVLMVGCGGSNSDLVKDTLDPTAPETLRTMFTDLAVETDWDISGDMVWSYHFANPIKDALDSLSAELKNLGYNQVSLEEFSDGKPQWALHVEKVERMTPEQLVNAGAKMQALTDKHQVHDFLEVKVSPLNEIPKESTYGQAWWTYRADYGGKPGEVSLNLALREGAPYLDFPSIVITGLDYTSGSEDGQPNQADLDLIYDLRIKRISDLKLHTYAIEAGALILDGEETHYIYVNDTTGIEELLREFYTENYPDRKFRINIKGNIGWDAYLRQLFPNTATINFYESELKKLELWQWVEDSR